MSHLKLELTLLTVPEAYPLPNPDPNIHYLATGYYPAWAECRLHIADLDKFWPLWAQFQVPNIY